MTELEEAEYCINSVVKFIVDHPNNEDALTFYNHWIRDTKIRVRYQSNAVRVYKVIENYKARIANDDSLRRYLNGRC